MPKFSSHELLGIAVWLVFLVLIVLNYSFKVEKLLLVLLSGFIVCFVGSILPDIDNKNSVAFKRTRLILGLLVFVVFFSLLPNEQELSKVLVRLVSSGAVAVAVVLVFQAILPHHRGPIHSFKAAGVYAVIVYVLATLMFSNLVLGFIFAVFGFLSFVSHLFLDRIIKDKK